MVLMSGHPPPPPQIISTGNNQREELGGLDKIKLGSLKLILYVLHVYMSNHVTVM